jgi:hypothetical protein
MRSTNGQDPTLLADNPFPDLDMLAGVQPQLSEATRFITEGFRDPSLMPASTSEVLIREGQPMLQRVVWPHQRELAKFVAASAGLVVQEVEGSDSESSFINDLLQTHLGEIAEDDDLVHISSRITEAVDKIRALRGFSEIIIGTLKNTAATTGEQFELMKLLAQNSSGTIDSAASLQILDTFAALDDTKKGISIDIENSLEAGAFDSLIGEAILRDGEDEGSELSDHDRSEIRKLRAFGASFAEEAMPFSVIAKLTEPKRLAQWPDHLEKLLNARKSHYLQALKDNHAHYENFLTEYRCIPSASTAEEVNKLADKIIIKTTQDRMTDTALPMRERINAKATLGKARKRRRSSDTTASELSPQGQQAEINAAPKPRKLAYVRPDRSEAPEGSSAFNKLFDDYLAKHRGQAGLSETLEEIKNYLKEIDLSEQEKSRGISPYRFDKKRLKARERRLLSNVYQLDPSQAVGLSTTSESSKNLRIVFILDETEVKILGIEQGDKAETIKRKIDTPDSPGII